MVYVPPPADCCSITLIPLTDLRRDNRLVRTPCNHFFDRTAIQEWIITQKKTSCPLCERHITIRDIRSEPGDGILARIGRFICSFFEFLWKGIICLCELSVEEERYSSRRSTTIVYNAYVPPHSREPTRRDVRYPYVPPAASRASLGGRDRNAYSTTSARDSSGGRASLGGREENIYGTGADNSSTQNGRVKLGNRT